jgi:hypothetical protein
VLWDNGFTMHRRTPFDPAARRLMKRMTLHLDPHRQVMPDGLIARSGRACRFSDGAFGGKIGAQI